MPRRPRRFKLRDSDRSGFTYFEHELVPDGPWLVHPEELDAPAPSRTPGGEGVIHRGAMREPSEGIASLMTPTSLDHPTVVIDAAGLRVTTAHPWMKVAGSSALVDITADPQFTAGQQNQVLTVQCVSNQIVLDQGAGLAMLGSVGYIMDSGAISTFMYHTGGRVWQETSRRRGG